jgi:hypothetical protein
MLRCPAVKLSRFEKKLAKADARLCDTCNMVSIFDALLLTTSSIKPEGKVLKAMEDVEKKEVQTEQMQND